MYRPMHTPYFSLWRRRLAPLRRRLAACRHIPAVDIETQFSRFLRPGTLAPPAFGPGSRDRVYSLPRIFWCFLWQVLQPRTPCRAVLRQIQAFGETPDRPIDENTSAYCQARQRLPQTRVDAALRQSAEAAERLCPEGVPGWTRRVRAADASCIRLPDTLKNRTVYPYAGGQRPGCGFPYMKILALFSLASGAILEVVQGAWKLSEIRLFLRLRQYLCRGDVLLGDRIFGSFFMLASLPRLGVDVVSRLNQCRGFGPGRAQRLGPSEWLVRLDRPQKCPPYLSAADWQDLPAQITVRLIRSRLARPGFRTTEVWLSTTLLDAQAYPAAQIVALYLRRWEMELCLRDLKTTMGMEELRCLSPAMVEKELRMFVTAHNLIRCLMAEAAATHGVPRTRISFKGTIDAARSFHQAMRLARSARQTRQLHARLLEILALDLVPLRLGRAEPRAVKRRPKPYQRLTRHRRLFREIVHRGKRRGPLPWLS